MLRKGCELVLMCFEGALTSLLQTLIEIIKVLVCVVEALLKVSLGPAGLKVL